ncbi:MAG: Smr/MutS family protein [Kofleriaceae bacterium]
MSERSGVPEDEGLSSDDAPLAVELTDELDLHTFLPRECADVVTEYLHAAHEGGLRVVRVVHGKGTGALRRTVHAALARHPLVDRYALDDGRGGWGATRVWLRDAAAADDDT